MYSEVREVVRPKTAITVDTATPFARITRRRAGTAAKVARISPLEYSPATASAPKLAARTVMKPQVASL